MSDFVTWIVAGVIVAAIILAGVYTIWKLGQFIIWFWRYKP